MKGILEIITLNKVNLKFSYIWEQEKYVFFSIYICDSGLVFWKKIVELFE